MATWQAQIFLIPTKMASAFENVLSQAEFAALRERSLAIPVDKDCLRYLDDRLRRGPTWSENVLIWGNIEETCIIASGVASCWDEAEIRLDLRTISSTFIYELISFLKNIGCSIITEKHEILPAEYESIRHAISQSEALQFVRNPHLFLDDRKD